MDQKRPPSFFSQPPSNVASGGQGAEKRQNTPHIKKFAKNWEKREKFGKKEGNEGKIWKRGKNWGKREKIRKKRQKSGRFFHFTPPNREGWLRHCDRHLVGTIILRVRASEIKHTIMLKSRQTTQFFSHPNHTIFQSPINAVIWATTHSATILWLIWRIHTDGS